MITLSLLALASITMMVLWYKVVQKQDTIERQAMEIKRFRDALCKGDKIRTVNGQIVTVQHVGRDVVFVVNEYGDLHPVHKETILPLVLN